MEWDGQGISGTSLLSKLFCDSEISEKQVVAEKFELQEISIADPGLMDQDPLIRGMDPAPDPSLIKKNSKKTLNSDCFATS
jgi:hypothetical protein